MKRRKLGRKKSRKMFSKTAKRTHKRNLIESPMRGGIRF